jgi:hypothetical protein
MLEMHGVTRVSMAVSPHVLGVDAPEDRTLVMGASIKTIYDVLPYFVFRWVRPPEERVASR